MIKKIKMLLLVLPILSINCNSTGEYFHSYDLTIHYENQTDVVVKITGNCGFQELERVDTIYIDANSTISVLNLDMEVYTKNQPNIDTISPFKGGGCFAVYSESIKCDYGYISSIGDSGFRLIENYTDREKISKNSFEITYTFTQETMDAAVECQ